jgi:hypothetical protein
MVRRCCSTPVLSLFLLRKHGAQEGPVADREPNARAANQRN